MSANLKPVIEPLTLIYERAKARLVTSQIEGDYRNVHRQFQLEHRTGRLVFHYLRGGIIGTEFERFDNLPVDKSDG